MAGVSRLFLQQIKNQRCQISNSAVLKNYFCKATTAQKTKFGLCGYCLQFFLQSLRR